MDARVTVFAVAEAKARFSELIARAEAGEDITIKRHGRAVAVLSSLARRSPAAVDDASAKVWGDWFAYRDAHAIELGPDLAIADLLADTRDDNR